MSNKTNQKGKQSVICAALGILLAFSSICSTTLAEPSYLVAITQITDNGYEDTMPRIWGNNVAWAGRYEDSDFEILFWDGNSTKPISSHGGNDLDPRIWGNKVVWRYHDGIDHELYFWDGSTTTRITNDSYDDIGHQIWGNNVVWVHDDGNDNEIYLWDGNSTTHVTNNSYDDRGPQISGNNVVWQGSDGSDYEIFFWDGMTTTQITNNTYDDKEPQISGNNVVWYGKPGGIDGAIFFWDGMETTQITYGTDDKYPQISGNNVTWQGSDGNDFEIYFWDGSAITKVTNNNDWDIRPRISGNNVVWVGEPNEYYKVFFWDGSTITQISDNCSSNVYHQISGNNVVWRGASIYDEYEIFFSHLVPLGHISGTKWHDENGNYIQDLDEQGLPGWRIFADLNENGQFDVNEPNTLTDINGQYHLAVATENPTVMIAEEQKIYWQQTYPGGTGAYTLSFTPGEVIENINFGNALPWEIDPSQWDLQDKLTASDGEYHDYFGTSVATSGDYSIIGMMGSEAAYLFKRDGSSWIQHTKLFVDLGIGNFFGRSVTISGDYAMVGGHRYDGYTGAAYIFYRNEGGTDNWGLQATLTASDGAQMDYLARTVSISGDYAIAGANGDDDDGSSSGSAYIFYRNEGGPDNWGQQAKLKASDATGGDFFGRSVAICGDYAIAGAHGDEDDGTDSGSAYVFKRNGSTWSQHAKLKALDADAEDYFGFDVSISDDYALISAKNDEENGSDSGSAYIFKRDGSIWSQQDKLTALDGNQDDEFGYTVSINGDYAVVGVDKDDDNGSNSGSVYMFKREETDWIPLLKLVAPDGAAGDGFGRSVSINGDYVLVGAYADDHIEDDVGSAYIFNKVFLCPTADLTDDCKVNLDDIAVVASQWLQGMQ